MPIALTKGLDFRCCTCGIALRAEEIAYEIVDGLYVDYITHKPGRITGMLFCSGCRDKLYLNNASDQGAAIMKRKELERDGAQDTGIVKIKVTNDTPKKPIEFEDTYQYDQNDFPDGMGAGM